MRTLYRLLLAGFYRRWREGTIAMMVHAFGGVFEHCGESRQCYSASTFLARSSIWDTSA
jgi:hypothetical protein